MPREKITDPRLIESLEREAGAIQQPARQAITDPQLIADLESRRRERLSREMAHPTLPPSPQVSPARAAALGAGQGAFLGFGDELAGTLVAGAAKAGRDPRPFGEIRDEVIEAERAELERAMAERPEAVVPGALAGGLITAKPILGALSAARVPAAGACFLASCFSMSPGA